MSIKEKIDDNIDKIKEEERYNKWFFKLSELKASKLDEEKNKKIKLKLEEGNEIENERQKEIEKYKNEFERKKKELKELKEKIKKFEEEENKQLKQKIIDLSKSQVINQITINNYKNENKKYKDKINILETQINDYKEELSKMQEIDLKKKQSINDTKLLKPQIKEIKGKNEEKELEKKEFEKNLKIKYDNILEEEKIKMNQMLINKLNEKQKELEINYKQMYTNKELEMQRKYDEMRNQLEKKNESNKTIHHGIKCNQCFQYPIIGYRYKCCECFDYNLCEKCKENNSKSGEHSHDFIKMKNEKKKISFKENSKNK